MANAHPQYLFLAAVGRSGTTIFRRSLRLHPEVYYHGKENNVVQDVLRAALKNCTVDSRRKAMLLEQEEYDAAFRKLLVELIWPRQRQRKEKPVHFAAINPTGDILDYLCQVFPGAKVIGLVRNGIGVICSRQRYGAFAGQDFEKHCEVWEKSAGVLDWGQDNPERFFLFRQEWMYLPELEGRLTQLFDWTGIGACDDVSANIRGVLANPGDREVEGYESLSAEEKRAVFERRLEGWKNWTDAQRGTFKLKCGALMQRLGYAMPF
ncbi:MAG: sulfotransferase [Planctomycetota bacterium]